ncbi:efflux transporter outer membrane subunit [Coralloluteibacterium thermophilus]|uniref:Efflux transporter outer membrane subunit n=1 Tax=Coralloluteibacterium thermophilum TaxID=2707049 RepID=A0ABV9NMR8_9GAMM
MILPTLPGPALRRGLLLALLPLALAACTVGPDHVRPDPPAPERFLRDTPHGAHARTLDAAWRTDGQAAFWRAFGDPLLEVLVDEALLANHDLRIALARYDQANALLRGARMDRLPTLSASASGGDVRASAAQAPGLDRAARDGEQYEAGLRALWELDFFGRIRRGIEARNADAEASAADLAAVQVAVVGDLVEAYMQLRGFQAQLRVAQDNARNQADTLRLVEARADAGRDAPFDVARVRAQLESTRARIPALEAAVAVTAHRIAVLTGNTPEALALELEEAMPLPPLPDVALDATPAELLRRRPDVVAAERRLHAATARIGVATADLFPRFTLGGLIGSQALSVSDLFERDSETRAITLGIDGSFLDVGRVRARIAAADAAAAADLAAYEGTVLRALEETENALVRLSRAERERVHLEAAAEASGSAARTARVRFENGASNVLDVLDAERVRLAAEDALAQGRTRNASAVVALYRTLAGGWPQQLPARHEVAER